LLRLFSVGVAVSILGIAVVLGSPGSGSSLSGLLLILAGTASWGLGQALIRRYSRDATRQLIGVTSLMATPQLLIVSFAVERNHLHLLATGSAYEWFGVTLLGFGSFVAAYLIWYWLLERNRMDQVAPFAGHPQFVCHGLTEFHRLKGSGRGIEEALGSNRQRGGW
jgi:O-acetylserine/cysteine efflux transporter